MNWLGTHLREFVAPKLEVLLAQKLGRTVTIDLDKIRPSKECPHEEAGLIYAVLKSHGFQAMTKKTWNQPEIDCTEETYALLRGTNDVVVVQKLFGNRYRSAISNRSGNIAVTCHSAVRASLRQAYDLSIKTGKKVVLTGRDMWLWEVLAHKYGIPVVYDPRVSRDVAKDHEAFVNAVIEWGVPDLNRTILLDTGFSGTIWQHLCKATGDKPVSLMMSAEGNKPGTKLLKTNGQQFPTLMCARDIAYKIEDTPKYWLSGTTERKIGPQGKPISVPKQDLALLVEFIQAVALTIWCWHFKSPNFIHSDKYLGNAKDEQKERALKAKRAAKLAKKKAKFRKNKDNRNIARRSRAIEKMLRSVMKQDLNVDQIFDGLEMTAQCVVCAVEGQCESCRKCHHTEVADRKEYFLKVMKGGSNQEESIKLIGMIKTHLAAMKAKTTP
jgi:hypothetical protein